MPYEPDEVSNAICRCSCGKPFGSVSALNQHVAATGHALSEEQKEVGLPVGDQSLKLEIAVIEGNEALVEFVCGKCNWPVDRDQRACGYCGEPLVWGDKDATI